MDRFDSYHNTDHLEIYRSEIINLLKSKFEKYKKDEEKNKIKEYEDMCKIDLYRFCSSLYCKMPFGILDKIDAKVFYSSFIHANTETKYNIRFSLENILKKYHISTWISFLPFFTKLQGLLDKGKSQHAKKTVSGYCYKEFQQYINTKTEQINTFIEQNKSSI